MRQLNVFFKSPVLPSQAGAIGLTDILGHASPADEDMTKAARAGVSVLNAAVRKMTGTSLTATTDTEVSSGLSAQSRFSYNRCTRMQSPLGLAGAKASRAVLRRPGVLSPMQCTYANLSPADIYAAPLCGSKPCRSARMPEP